MISMGRREVSNCSSSFPSSSSASSYSSDIGDVRDADKANEPAFVLAGLR